MSLLVSHALVSPGERPLTGCHQVSPGYQVSPGCHPGIRHQASGQVPQVPVPGGRVPPAGTVALQYSQGVQ